MKGAYIRQQRKRLGLSQPELGGLVGTDGTSVSRWERGVVEVGPENEERLQAVFAGRNGPITVEDRLASIEEKLDQLLARSPVRD